MMRTKIFLGLAVAGCAASISFTTGCGSKSPAVTGQAGAAGQAGVTGAAGSAGTGAAGSAGATGLAGTGSDAAAGASRDGGVAGQGGAPSDGGADAGSNSGPCTVFLKDDQPIEKLTQTGCMDPTTPTKLNASVVLPYEVNSPLWSDKADKSRGFAMPKGSKIHVKDCATASAECTQGPQDTGKWVMPVGTVMVKNFGFDGKLVETRLLMHPNATTWNGYSYQWNEAQTEALVLPDDRKAISFNTGTRTVMWNYPNRFDCNGCHTQSAGGTLGPETRQMNRKVAGAAQNQLDAWKALGLFEGTGPAMPYQAALVLPYSGQLGTTPVGATKEALARSYLHANCAYCHRPDGDFPSMDFRLDTTVKNMGACGVAPMKSTVGVDGALIIKPGKPMESVMWLRMHSPKIDEKTRMPQLATYVVDDLGLAVVSDWITSLAACP